MVSISGYHTAFQTTNAYAMVAIPGAYHFFSYLQGFRRNSKTRAVGLAITT
jgi:hypothetical protein